MRRLLAIIALLPALALAGTPLALKYDSQTGATTDIPSSLTKINFPAGFQLQVAGVPIGSSSFSTITGQPTDNANLSAALAARQPLDSDLTSIAALSTNSFGLQLLTKADAASIRSYIGAGTSLAGLASQVAHVDPNGSNATGAIGDISHPFQTVQAAINAIQVASPGDGSNYAVDIGANSTTESVTTSLLFLNIISRNLDAGRVCNSLTFTESSADVTLTLQNANGPAVFCSTTGLLQINLNAAKVDDVLSSNGAIQINSEVNDGLVDGAVTGGGDLDIEVSVNGIISAPGFGITLFNCLPTVMNAFSGLYNLASIDSTGSVVAAYNSLVKDVTNADSLTLVDSRVLGTNSAGSTIYSDRLLAGDDTAYNATSWNGNTRTPTKNAVRDKFESLGALSTVSPGTGVATALAVNVGSAGAFVTNDGSIGLVKPAVAVVSVSNLTLSGEQTLDGITTSGSLVLCTAQSTGANNGPWISASGSWTRPTWYSNASTTQAPQFLTTFVRLGTVYSGSTWRMTTANVTIGTTATTWVQTPLAMSATSITGNLPASAFGNVAVADGLSITLTSVATFGINSISGSKISGGTLGATAGTNLTGTAVSLTAGNATKWATGRTIALTGDVTYTSGSLDGSGNVTGASTLANIPAISGVNLTNLNATNLGIGTVPTARLGSGTANSTTVLYGDQTYKTAPTIATTSAVLKGDGSGNAVAATAGTDFLSVSGTAAQTITLNALGAATSDAVFIKNTTAATSSVQQWSPALHFLAHGWHSNGTPADTTYDLKAYLRTVSTGDPSASGGNGGLLVWASQFNSGGYSDLATLDFTGAFSTSSVSASQGVTAATNVTAGQRFSASGASYLDGRTDGKWIMTNNAGTGFTALQFGGTTSSFPEIKRNSTQLQARLADDSSDADLTAGNLISNTAGSGLQIKGGSNAKIGSGTLVGGTATISNTSVTANSKIFLQDTSTSVTNVGVLTVSSKTAGTGFVVTSTLALDTSTFDYWIVEAN